MSNENNSSHLVDQLRLRQAESWSAGVGVSVEELLDSIAPNNLGDDEILGLIYSEMCMVEAGGVVCSLSDYSARLTLARFQLTNTPFHKGRLPAKTNWRTSPTEACQGGL